MADLLVQVTEIVSGEKQRLTLAEVAAKIIENNPHVPYQQEGLELAIGHMMRHKPEWLPVADRILIRV